MARYESQRPVIVGLDPPHPWPVLFHLIEPLAPADTMLARRDATALAVELFGAETVVTVRLGGEPPVELALRTPGTAATHIDERLANDRNWKQLYK